MKNITVAIDDDTYERARRHAIERATSVSAMVKQFLRSVSANETEDERWLRELSALQAKVREQAAKAATLVPIHDLTRTELHDRDARRADR